MHVEGALGSIKFIKKNIVNFLMISLVTFAIFLFFAKKSCNFFINKCLC